MTSPYSGGEDTRGLCLQKSPVTASLWLVPFEGLSTRALDVFPLTVTQCLTQAAQGKDLSLLKISRDTWQEHHGVGQFHDGGGMQLRILFSDSSRTGSRAKQVVAINLRNSLPLFRNTSYRFHNHPKQRPQLVTKCPNPRPYVGTFHNMPSWQGWYQNHPAALSSVANWGVKIITIKNNVVLSRYCRHRCIFVKGQQRTVFISDASNTSFWRAWCVLRKSGQLWAGHTEFSTVLTSVIGMLPI